ncbi:YjbQ family protein [Bacillus cabrialesii subsp. cabrialesii]|uniref:YjbQ family protein n=1 Tax=Bacillus cabrialesii TaxID=2487276 RepID=UPI003305730F
MVEITIQSKGFNHSYDITEQVTDALSQLEPSSGLAKVCVTGSTVGLTVMRYEPGTVQDLLQCLESIASKNKQYEHFNTTGDSNGFSHVWSTIIGTSVMVPYKNHKLACSDSHRVVLFDFDLREAERKIYVDH